MQSFALSLEHLQTTYVDSYVLHGPSVGGTKLGPKDWEVWRAMEQIHVRGAAKHLGISNVSSQLREKNMKKRDHTPDLLECNCLLYLSVIIYFI